MLNFQLGKNTNTNQWIHVVKHIVKVGMVLTRICEKALFNLFVLFSTGVFKEDAILI